MSVIVGNQAIVRGAPETVLERCRESGDAQQAMVRMAERGLRVVAIAVRNLDGREIPETPDAVEVDLTLLGLVGIQDPPRLGVADSIAACRRAGIRVAMITGDHPATARAIAREVGSRNITCNAVAPGFIETAMTAGLAEDFKKEALKLIPLARIGTPEDVASAVAFLASDESSYITGHVLSVNGGMLMG